MISFDFHFSSVNIHDIKLDHLQSMTLTTDYMPDIRPGKPHGWVWVLGGGIWYSWL